MEVEFTVAWLNGLVAASCALWWCVSAATHAVTVTTWPGYSSLPRLHRRQWCNKVASGAHAALIAAGQAFTLRHPAVVADPLHGTCAGHYVWSAVLAGYLLYDTMYCLTYYPLNGSTAPFLVHHLVGLAGCALGLYAGKMALSGAALCVLLESTTPLLHVLGCMKLAGRTGERLYRRLGLLFIAQYFILRVLAANWYLAQLAHAVLRSTDRPWWAWAGLAVFTALSGLSLLWFGKLIAVARETRAGGADAAAQVPAEAPAEAEACLGAAPARRRQVHVTAFMPPAAS